MKSKQQNHLTAPVPGFNQEKNTKTKKNKKLTFMDQLKVVLVVLSASIGGIEIYTSTSILESIVGYFIIFLATQSMLQDTLAAKLYYKNYSKLKTLHQTMLKEKNKIESDKEKTISLMQAMEKDYSKFKKEYDTFKKIRGEVK